MESPMMHVWASGLAGEPWLSAALTLHLRFIVRWKKGNKWVNATDELKTAWEIRRVNTPPIIG